MDEPWAHTNSQDSPQPELGGSHHLPFYNIFDWAQGATSKCNFVSRFPS